MGSSFFRTLGRLDWWGVALALTVMGLVMQYSLAFSGETPNPGFFWRQLIAAILGIGLAFFVSRQDYHLWQTAKWWWYALVLLLLIAVLVFGQEINSTRGWFILGPVQFQPVEVVKVFLALGMACLVASWTAGQPTWKQLLSSVIFIGIPFLLIAKQPDMGSALLLWVVWVALAWIGGITWKQIAVIVGGVLIVVILTWLFFLKPYQKDRIEVFFNPNSSPLAAGYQVRQAVIAVGSGSWLGRGLGEGTQTQLNFLPDARTDFVFAALAEELGLVGMLVVLALFGFFLRASWQAAHYPVDQFVSLSIGGLTALLLVQAGLNMAMNVGWSPVIGVPLPFLSYGGSSMIGSWLIIGILQSFMHGRGRG